MHIDAYKGLLVLGMVLAHVIQLLGDGQSQVLASMSFFANLVSFPGFLMCFGCVSWSAYLINRQTPWRSICQTALKCYLAFVFSGLAYLRFVAKYDLDLWTLLDVAFLRKIPGYSEFLLSFALVTLLAPLLKKLVDEATSNSLKLILVVSTFGVVSLFHAGRNHDPVIGLMIGGTGFSYFPVIQYFPVYLLGVALRRTSFALCPRLLLGSLLTITMLAVAREQGLKVSRFPPSAIWVLASAGCAYVYFFCSVMAIKLLPPFIAHSLQVLGRRSLSYLLISNIAIFSGYAAGLARSLDPNDVVLFFLSTMVIGFTTNYLVNVAFRSRTHTKQAVGRRSQAA